MRTSAVRPVRITLAVGLVVLAVSVLATLTHAAPRLAGSNDVEATAIAGEAPASGWRHCQGGEILPQGTAAVRLALQSGTGPAVGVVALADGRRVAAGRRAPGWGGSSVVVDLRSRPSRELAVRVCVTVGAGADRVDVLGPAAGTMTGPLRIDYLDAGGASWWSRLPAIVTRIGRGHAWSGPSVAIVIAMLMLAAIGLALRQTDRIDEREGP